MRARAAIFAAAVALTTAAGALQGCVTNPATGRTTFTGGMTTADEIRMKVSGSLSSREPSASSSK